MVNMFEVAPRVATGVHRLNQEHPKQRGWIWLVEPDAENLLAQLNELAKKCEALQNASDEELVELGLRPSTSNGDESEHKLMVLAWKSEIEAWRRREKEGHGKQANVTRKPASHFSW